MTHLPPHLPSTVFIIPSNIFTFLLRTIFLLSGDKSPVLCIRKTVYSILVLEGYFYWYETLGDSTLSLQLSCMRFIELPEYLIRIFHQFWKVSSYYLFNYFSGLFPLMLLGLQFTDMKVHAPLSLTHLFYFIFTYFAFSLTPLHLRWVFSVDLVLRSSILYSVVTNLLSGPSTEVLTLHVFISK